MLITATVVAFVLMMRADRRAAAPLLPSDAFSLRSGTGAGLWMILLMSVGYSPLAIYAPLFLQRLRGVSPLGAGYMVALASLAWTTAALSVASLSEEWPPRLIIMGPSAMGACLAGMGVLMAPGPVAALILPIVLIGAGIGVAWAFVLQRVMSGAKGGEENSCVRAGDPFDFQQPHGSLLTRPWREVDSNLYGAFPVKWLFSV
jgi:hypothetical protein